MPRGSAAEAPPGAEKFTFVLNSVDLQGATAYPAGELQTFYTALVGKTVTVADMFKVASEIELKYRSAGYVTSRVIVPAQTIEGGIFRIQVVEGFVSEVVFADDIGPARAAVEMLLAPLRNVVPISLHDIERQLLLADDISGLTVRGSLEASPKEVGGSVIVVKLERKPFNVSATYDNRSSPFIGPQELLQSVTWNAFGSHGDQITLTAKQSLPFKRQWLILGNYQGVFTSGGLTLGLTSSFSHSKPGDILNPLLVTSKVAANTATTTYPIIRSRLENLRAVGEFEYRDVSTDEATVKPFNRDRLRILRGGFSYDRTDGWDGITALRAMMHQGLPIMGATHSGTAVASRPGADGVYTKYTLSATRIQQLPKDFSILATTTAQWSKHPLLASEQIALGGSNFGRAFDEGEIAGDKGWAGLVELRYSPPVPDFLAKGLQFYAFADTGQVFNTNPAAPLANHTVVSFGGGVRANLHEYVFTTLEFAQAVHPIVASQRGKPMRVFFNLTVHY